MAPPKRKFPSTHTVRRSKKAKTSVEQPAKAGSLDNALVNLHKNVSLCATRNTVIGYDPGPNNGTFCLFVYGREGLAALHGLCIPMKVDLFQEAGDKADSTVQECRDRLVAWIRATAWVTQQAALVVIERQLIATSRGGRTEFANQKTNTLATTLESKWEDVVVASGARLPIAPISKESFHFAYPHIFPVPPADVDAHEFNKQSVVRYAEHQDALLAPFERQWVEADFTRNYYGQLAAGRTRTPKREADDYYDSAIFAMGGFEHAHAPESRPNIIGYRAANARRITLDLFVCPDIDMDGEYELFSDGWRLMLVFRDAAHPLLRWVEALSAYAFDEGAVMKIGNKHRLSSALLRPMRGQLLPCVKTSSELCIPIDLTNEHE